MRLAGIAGVRACVPLEAQERQGDRDIPKCEGSFLGDDVPQTFRCGFVSAVGERRGSQRYGAFVDQAVELDVVIGSGTIVICRAVSV